MVVCSADITLLIGHDIINGLEPNFTRSSSVSAVSSLASVQDDSGATPSSATKHYEVSSIAQSSLNSSYTTLLHEFSMLTLDQLGVYPNFQHWIQLQPVTIAVIYHMRQAPVGACG